MNINYKNLMSILVSSVIIAFLYNFISPSGLSLIREETVVKNVTNIDYGDTDPESGQGLDIKGVNFNTMSELVEDKRVTIIDSRDQWEYGEGHIPGAISIPEFSFDPNNELVKSLNKNNVHVIYCEGDDCDVSKRLAKEFYKIGFKRVYVYLGGYAEWIENNMQVEVSE